MITRRTFLRNAAIAGGAHVIQPAVVEALPFGRGKSGYFSVHPFVDNHPEAVFIMRTNVAVKTDGKAKRAEGERFARSVFVPSGSNGVPVTNIVAIKPNLTGHTPENERFTLEDTMGIATDPDFVEGTIRSMKRLGLTGGQFYLREVNGARVFGPRGYYRMADRVGADLRDLRGRVSTIPEEKIEQWSRAPVIDDNLLQWRDVPDGKVHTRIPYLWPVNAPNAFTLNIAKFKSHFMGLTLCCKNFQGAVANGYQHFCTRGQGIDNLPEEHRNPGVKRYIDENLRRHVADRVPRWDRPEKDRKDPAWLRPDHYDVVCQEIWSNRALDNLAASNIGLHIVEGIYGRDGDGFLNGPNPPGSENDYLGAAWDYMTNIVIFGRDPLRVDLVGKWLGGHEPGNFGLFHIAMERGMLSVIDPMKVPVYVWEDGRATRKPLASFERTPLRTCYLPKNYGGFNEPIYHLVDEPFDYGRVRQVLHEIPDRPCSRVIGAGYPSGQDGLVSIEYSLPSDGEVLIQMLDGTGAPVDILARSICESGYHLASWDTKRFKSGRYSYVFRFGNYSETGEVVLKK